MGDLGVVTIVSVAMCALACGVQQYGSEAHGTLDDLDTSPRAGDLLVSDEDQKGTLGAKFTLANGEINVYVTCQSSVFRGDSPSASTNVIRNAAGIDVAFSANFNERLTSYRYDAAALARHRVHYSGGQFPRLPLGLRDAGVDSPSDQVRTLRSSDIGNTFYYFGAATPRKPRAVKIAALDEDVYVVSRGRTARSIVYLTSADEDVPGIDPEAPEIQPEDCGAILFDEDGFLVAMIHSYEEGNNPFATPLKPILDALSIRY